MVPGDDEHGLRNVVKIVSALTDETRGDLAGLYGSIVDAGIHEATTIEAAETAKCVENIQRDLNIALMNELAVACDHLGIDTRAVLEAAGTKWNFHDYRPGLVGATASPSIPSTLSTRPSATDSGPNSSARPGRSTSTFPSTSRR